ncbi:MAG: BatA domain-containing protein [Elusimicrobiota bacterium]
MSLSFLNTSFLFALPVALIPLILHLFYRKKQSVIYFSYIELIKKAAERTRIKSKIRRYLLLTVRTLILLLLVLLFARPVWRFGETGAGSKKAMSVILMIDASYSMGYVENGRTRFDRAIENAAKIIGMLPMKARAGIVAYSDRVEYASPSLSNDAVSLLQSLDRIKLTDRPTGFGSAWNAAQSLVAQSPDSECSVIILSDLARHGFGEKPAKSAVKSRILVFEPGKSSNLYITGMKGEYDELLSQWKIETYVASGYPGSRDTCPITYYSGARKAGSDLIALNNDGKTTCAFSYSSEETASAVRARLLEDPLDRDNVYYLALRRRDPFKVWILDGDPKSGGVTSESFYLKNVFPPADVLSENEFASAYFAVPGVVIAANIRAFPPAVERFVGSGGGLLIFPGDRTPDEFQNDLLPATLGQVFESRRNVSWSAPDEYFLSQAMDMRAFEWDKISVDKGYILQAKGGAQTVAVLADGWPFLVESRSGAGKVMLCASSADRDWNNLPGRPLYAPLMQNIIRYLSGTGTQNEISDIPVGEPFRYKSVASPEIVTPSGRTEKPKIISGELIFEKTDEPGFYRLLSSGREVFRFTVNLNTASGESDLEAASAGNLKKYFQDSPVAVLRAAEWERDLMILLTGIDASRHFIIAILLLILFELILANPRVTKNG